MVTPDGILGGKFPRVAKALVADGFEILGGHLFQLDVDALRRMYHHTSNPPEPTGGPDELPIDVLIAIYAQAPACVMSLARPGVSAASELCRLKGPTRPAMNPPSSIRHDGEHLVFNSLHSPDDEAAAHVELEMLVGTPTARSLEALRCPGADVQALAGADALAASLPRQEGWDAISYPMIANRVRTRLVMHMAVAYRGHEDVLASLRSVLTAISCEREALAVAGDSRARIEVARDHLPAIQQQLLDAIAAVDSPWGPAVRALGELLHPNAGHDIDDVVGLRQDGVYLSALEEASIRAQRHAMWADAVL